MAFFEQIGKKISNAGQGVAQQTKNLADIARLNSTISEKEKQIAQLHSSIGTQYFDHHKDDATCEFVEQVSAISALLSEIDQCKESIKQIKGVTKCPHCGAEIPAGSVFCNICGTKADTGVEIPKAENNDSISNQKICKTCGSIIPDENIFCSQCGTKYVDDHEEKVNIPNAVVDVCPKCGNTVPEGDMFCSNCGTKIER